MRGGAFLRAVSDEIRAQIGEVCDPEPARSVGGGDISQCYLWGTERGRLFVKVAGREELHMFEAEALGLRELAAARAVRTPEVRAVGCVPGAAFLALEWIERGASTPESERRLGERLAAQHWKLASRFGWQRDNTIGRTPQANGWLEDWAQFFCERRLRPQLELAARKGFDALTRRAPRLLAGVAALLSTHTPSASLLHGDLWGGNWLTDTQGEPVIFDPATYYGDREADLAMTRLFGGFGRAFYEAYEAAWPLPPGSSQRVELYNLYHLINHANLFGAGYARQASDVIDRLLG